MNQRPLGSTGLQVSEISLGTVALGLDYGFKNSRSYARPPEYEALRLLRSAPESGITLFDTASAYGESQRLIGSALAGRNVKPYIATKVAITPGAGASGQDTLMQSIDRSLAALGVDTIDVLQIHNATREVLAEEDALHALDSAVAQAKVRFLGASVYTEDDALAVLHHPRFRTLQVPFNLLDTTMAHRVIPLAARRGVAVLVRSAFLRGVLTDRIHEAPPQLDRLKQRALAALEYTGEPIEGLPALALRYCLSVPGVSSVIVGVRTIEELEANIAAAREGPLDAALFSRLQELAIPGDPLLSPLNWQGLI